MAAVYPAGPVPMMMTFSMVLRVVTRGIMPRNVVTASGFLFSYELSGWRPCQAEYCARSHSQIGLKKMFV